MSERAGKDTHMLAELCNLDRNQPVLLAACVIALGGAAALVGAWFFQYVIGLVPCPLCLEQRVAYYFAVPLAAMVVLGVQYGATPKVLQLALLAIGAAMLWNAGLGVFHSGVEWKWWPGPQECSGSTSFGSVRDLQDALKNARIVRCDEATWRFLGLSLAGYNMLISLTLAVIAVRGALAKRAVA
jgi:disulfide bond formation protein DsbB